MADLLLDPNVIEEQVRRLNRHADSVGIVGVVLGLVPGAAIGGFPVVAHGPIPPKYGIATLLLGALLGGLLGHIIASSRSFSHRLRAQLMLGQLRLEQNIEALLAVSERPAPMPALPAPEQSPMALPEAPRIEEIIQAGLGLPEPAPAVELTPAFEWSAPIAHEEIAPVEQEEPAPLDEAASEPELEPEAAPEPEPVNDPEPIQELIPPAPSWAAAFDEVLPTLGVEPEPVAPPEPEPAPATTWALPVRDEAPEASPATAAWATAEQEVHPAPTSTPTPLPMPEPLRPDFGSTTPAWAAPGTDPAPEEDEEPASPPPAAHTDLSSLSIAEIARLADAGSI